MGKFRFFPEALNSMTAEERKEHKEKLLRESIRYMYDNSPEYYQLRFKECGAEVEDIQTIEDLRKLPILMDKDRERLSMEGSLEKYGHPFGFHVCCDPGDILVTGGTSGTTGHPTYPYSVTYEDKEYISDVGAFMYNKVVGLGKGDRAWFVFPLGVYATSTLLPGLERAGILQLPIDIRLGPQVALELMKWTRPTFWWTGPTIIQHYMVLFEKLGIDPKDLKFKCIFTTGEIGCGIPDMKKQVEGAFNCRWYDFWAPSLTNISSSCDSAEFYGLHNFADDWDLSFEDLVDPETKEPLEIKDGVVGELVVTHLRKKASPYMKYATGDVVEVYTSECPGCGFKGYRGKVVGRCDDMITVKGVNVFGGAVMTTIRELMPRVTGHMRIIKEDPSPRVTQLKLRIEYAPGMENNLDDLALEVKRVMREKHRVTPEIEWTPPESLERPARKPPIFEKRY